MGREEPLKGKLEEALRGRGRGRGRGRRREGKRKGRGRVRRLENTYWLTKFNLTRSFTKRKPQSELKNENICVENIKKLTRSQHISIYFFKPSSFSSH